MTPMHARWQMQCETRMFSMGLSVADILTPEMVKTMAERPLIFAMANPDPEIKYELARKPAQMRLWPQGVRIIPTRSTMCLGFPYIFRGALDVRARAINEEMKVAASQALAALTKEDVPDSVLARLWSGSC